MTRTRFFSIGALPLALGLVACGGNELPPGGHHSLPAEAACGDGYDNDRDGYVDCADLDCRAAGGACTMAPPLDRSVATTLSEASAFLYAGPDPIQKGANPKAFDPRRMAMLRGKVVGLDGQPLAGAKVSIVDHEEYGYTLSRGDGLFDLAVNGGARLLVRYELEGYLSSERSSNPGWQRYARVPEVGLVPRSENTSRLRLDSGGYEVALGDPVEDEHGSRQPLVFFKSGTSATAELPNGDKQKLADVTLSITEYPFERTTGDDYVPTARFAPGTLPLSGGLHYGLEFSIAEAEKLDARRVTLSEPAVIYVENFLGLSVGSSVPLGYYDPKAGQWQRATGGRVVRVLGIDAGRAVLDLDGDGTPDDEHALTTAKVSNEELKAIASHYAKDATLWRASVQHFSSWDMQFPVRPPTDAVGPTSRLAFSRSLDQPTRRGPSVVERMALSQSIPITGTPYALAYQSDRTTAYGAGFQFELPLLGEEVPPGLKRVISSVEIAGQQLTEFGEPTANLERLVLWDGKDGFGRLVQGPQLAHVAVSFVFDGELEVSDTFGVSGSNEADLAVNDALDAGDAVISQDFDVPLGVWDAKGYALGGFTLDVLHAYDPASQAVYFGWGDERTAQNIALVVTRPGKDFVLGTPDSIGPAGNGSLFVSDDDENEAGAGRVLEIAPDGQVFVIAGAGAAGPAGELTLDSPQGVVVKGDGTVLVADLQNDAVREIRTDGSVRTLLGPSSDDPVVEADLSHVDGMALGPREELYVVDEGRVLRVEGDKASVLAGGVVGDGTGDAGDGGPAASAILVAPSGVAAAPDGTVFISERGSDEAEGGHRIRKVSPDGTITTVAGNGRPGFSGDGGSGKLAELHSPRGLALAPDGSLYIADQDNDRIRRLTTEGIIQTIVGGGEAELQEGQLAEQVKLDAPDGIAVDRQGILYVGAGESVYRVAPGQPELTASEALVPSTDGRTLYRFDARGRHEATIDAMTGVVELTFAYDDDGHLATLKDKNGLVTTIERNPDGTPKAIEGPFKQRTLLELDDGGGIRTVTDPLGRSVAFEYDGPLLKKTVDPEGGEHAYEYDSLGLLARATEPNGYSEALKRTTTPNGYSVLVSEPSGVTTDYALALDAGGTLKRKVRYPDNSVLQWDDALVSTTRKETDGSSLTTRFMPDDAFGAQALFPSEITLKTPGGKVLTALGQRGKRLSDIDNRLSVEEWTEQIEVNGRTSEALYITKDRSLTLISPAGRKRTTELDERGRATKVSAAGLANTRVEYDDAGRVIRLTTSADGEERRVSYAYGSDGLLKASTAPNDTTVTYGRDLVGRITSLLRPDGESVESAFDENDNLTSLTPPGRGAHVFDFGGPKNLLAKSTPPVVTGKAAAGLAVGETKYEYSDGFELAKVKRSDGRDVGFGYDATTHKLTSISLADATLSYAYDSSGTLTSARRSDGAKVALAHDGPLLTSATWSGPIEGSVSATYDDDFRVAALTVNGSVSSKYTYDDDGLVTSATANGVTFELERDPDTGFVTDTTLGTVTTATDFNGFGEVSRLRAAFQGDVNFTQALERDVLGRVTKITETAGDETHDIRYQYDDLGRLTKATRNGKVTTYGYDKNGNRTRAQSDDEDLDGTYDAQDRVTRFGTLTVEQSSTGDLFRASDELGAIELGYDELGHLLTVTQSDAQDSQEISYVIDGLGRRVARQVNGAFDKAWLYVDARPVAEIDSNGVFSHFIYASPVDLAPDYILRSGVPLRVIKDHLGSVRLVVNAQSGVVEQKLDYDEFGRILEDTRPGFQPFGFAGGLQDPDSHLVHFGARDYSPKLGRWVAKDPSGFGGGDTNVYAYCANDPVNLFDPSGKEPLTTTAVAAACILQPEVCAAVLAVGVVVAAVAGYEIGRAVEKSRAEPKAVPRTRRKEKELLVFFRGTSVYSAAEIIATQKLDVARIMADQKAVGALKGVYVSSQYTTAYSFADSSFGDGRRGGHAVVRITVPADRFREFAATHGIPVETPVVRPNAEGQTETVIPFPFVPEFDSFSVYSQVYP